jgi:hypothetical protein
MDQNHPRAGLEEALELAEKALAEAERVAQQKRDEVYELRRLVNAHNNQRTAEAELLAAGFTQADIALMQRVVTRASASKKLSQTHSYGRLYNTVNFANPRMFANSAFMIDARRSVANMMWRIMKRDTTDKGAVLRERVKEFWRDANRGE